MCQDLSSPFCKRSCLGIKIGGILAFVFTNILSNSKLFVMTTSEGSWCDIGKAPSRQTEKGKLYYTTLPTVKNYVALVTGE